MLDLALKMLLGDKAKYIMLISGLTFASLLMTEQAGIFCGIMQWTGSTLDNVNAPIWVVDPMVEQVNDTEAMRDTDISRVRSVNLPMSSAGMSSPRPHPRPAWSSEKRPHNGQTDGDSNEPRHYPPGERLTG